MTGQDIDYAKHRLMRSQETLDEAEHLFQGGFTKGVVNRIYYACFYSVSALLSVEGHARSKHSGVMSLFDKLWIGPGKLPREMGTFYHLMFEQRQMGDYEEAPAFEAADLERWLAKARAFVGQADTWLRDNEGLTLD